jgi:hypothetical protein
MDDEQFLNSYHNASTPPGPDVPADLAGFMVAADPVLAQAAELLGERAGATNSLIAANSSATWPGGGLDQLLEVHAGHAIQAAVGGT